MNYYIKSLEPVSVRTMVTLDDVVGSAFLQLGGYELI
jgi:hypothetical protein